MRALHFKDIQSLNTIKFDDSKRKRVSRVNGTMQDRTAGRLCARR
jgi:hypothetical protein